MADQALFRFKEYVQLCQADRNAPNINLPMIQYNIKINKGVTNTIDFIVRNNDRKPVNLVGYQIKALIQRVDQPELLLTKTVQATDETAGKARLTLSSGEIEDWLAGYYQYSIRLTDITGKDEYLYTDINRSVIGTFELLETIAQSLEPAIEITADKFTPYPLGYYDNTWNTGALAGDAQKNQSNGMHTVVAYTDKFKGKLCIQASLSLSAPTEKDWFDINLAHPGPYYEYRYDPMHNKGHNEPIKVFNFTGNYYWVRIFYSVDPLNTGKFLKIQYKN
jgi:hypothetical protein